MQRRWIVAVAAALGAALPALAQQPGPPVGPRAMRGEAPPSGQFMRVYLNRRARLGIKVSLEARETDTLGAYVDAVTPGGPAALAGLRAGDVITRLDGRSVLAGGRAPVRQGESVPGLRLVELAARLQPDDSVAVEFRRGGRRHVASVLTAEEPDVLLEGLEAAEPFASGIGPAGGRPFVMTPDSPALMPPRMEFIYGSPLGELEVAPMNPELGRYFGTDEGVLVISAGKESSLGLRGGDVVLAVDGRRPVGPAHLLRIFRSYDQGEPFRIEVMRDRKRATVTGRLDRRN